MAMGGTKERLWARVRKKVERLGVLEEAENPVRGNWWRSWESPLALHGYTTGICNFWGWGFQLYYYGAAYLVTYPVMLLLVALPAMVVEMGVGQLTSRGPGHSIQFLCPAARGVGWAAMYTSFAAAVYYHCFNGWALYYLLSSIGEPWFSCEGSYHQIADYANINCLTAQEYKACVNHEPNRTIYAQRQCYDNNNVSMLVDGLGSCLRRDKEKDVDFAGCSLNINLNMSKLSPAQIFRINKNHSIAERVNASCQGVFLFSTRHSRQGWATDKDLTVLGAGWDQAKNGTFRIELDPTENMACHSSFVRDIFLAKTRCFTALMNVDWNKDVWDFLLAYCRSNWGEGMSNITCVRQVFHLTDAVSTAQFFHHKLNQADMGQLDSTGFDSQALITHFGNWAIAAVLLTMGPRWPIRFFPLAFIFPAVAFIIFFALAVNLNMYGTWEGALYLLSLRDSSLSWNGSVWFTTFIQIILDSGIALGGYSTLTRRDFIRDGLVVLGLNTVVGVMCFFSIASVIGATAWATDTDVNYVLQGNGIGVVYQVVTDLGMGYPKMSQLLSVLFFSMVLMLGYSSSSVMLEVILTWWEDSWPWLRGLRLPVSILFCLVASLLTCPLAAKTGMCVGAFCFQIIFFNMAPTTITATMILFVWVRGPTRLISDFRLMATQRGTLTHCLLYSPARWILFISIAALPLVCVYYWGQTLFVYYSGILPQFPILAQFLRILLGLGMWCLLVAAGLANAVWEVRKKGRPWRRLFRVTADWGPALEANRKETPFAERALEERTVAEAVGDTTLPTFLRSRTVCLDQDDQSRSSTKQRRPSTAHSVLDQATRLPSTYSSSDLTSDPTSSSPTQTLHSIKY